MENLQKDKENAQVQAAIATMPAKAGEAFMEASTVLRSVVGDNLSELGKQIFAQRGQLNQSQAAYLSMYGEAGTHYREAMMQFREAAETGVGMDEAQESVK
jgi:hypothetical protein